MASSAFIDRLMEDILRDLAQRDGNGDRDGERKRGHSEDDKAKIRSTWAYVKGMALNGLYMGHPLRKPLIEVLIKSFGAELGTETEVRLVPPTATMDITAAIMITLQSQRKLGAPYDLLSSVQTTLSSIVDRVEKDGFVKVTELEDLVTPLLRLADAAERVTIGGRVEQKDVEHCKRVAGVYRAVANAIVDAFEQTVNDALAKVEQSKPDESNKATEDTVD